MILFILPDCLICDLVQRAIQDLASKYEMTLDIQVADNFIPAVPALFYKDNLYIGEGIPYQLGLVLKGEN